MPRRIITSGALAIAVEQAEPTIWGLPPERTRDEGGCIICTLVVMVDLPWVTIRRASIPNGYLLAPARLAIRLE